VIFGSAGEDHIFGGGGNDRICAGGGDDTIEGGTGSDRIDAGAGGDEVIGGNGSDLVLAGPGIDTVVGERGNDRLYGGPGDEDYLNSGLGDDTVGGGRATATTRSAGWGTTTSPAARATRTYSRAISVPSAGDDNLNGSSGPGNGDQLYGGPGDDAIAEGSVLAGGGGSDLLIAYSCGETIDGGLGIDSVSFARSTYEGVEATLGGTAGIAPYGSFPGGCPTEHGGPPPSQISSSVERIEASPNGDILTGNGGPNVILGRGATTRSMAPAARTSWSAGEGAMPSMANPGRIASTPATATATKRSTAGRSPPPPPSSAATSPSPTRAIRRRATASKPARAPGPGKRAVNLSSRRSSLILSGRISPSPALGSEAGPGKPIVACQPRLPRRSTEVGQIRKGSFQVPFLLHPPLGLWEFSREPPAVVGSRARSDLPMKRPMAIQSSNCGSAGNRSQSRNPSNQGDFER
jgi:RTX calcium-binding nonapeptide repeat (4 copies)